MLLASGVNYGFRRTIPHLLGVSFGFTLMIVIVGAGIAELFESWPVAFKVLKILSVIYMLWLAWKIVNSGSPHSKTNDKKPMSFLQASLFQWINPKAWTMAIAAITIYTPNHDMKTVYVVALVFGLINLPSVGCYALMGQKLSGWLSHNHQLRIFNLVMATLLILSLVMIL